MPQPSDLLPFEVLERYPAHGGTLQGVLESRAAVQAGEVFLRDERGTLTWHAFRERVGQAVWLLRALAVKPGDRVGMMAVNSKDYVVIMFATMAAGAVFVPINPDLTASEARYIVDHAAPVLIFASTGSVPTLEAVSRSLGYGPRILHLDDGLEKLWRTCAEPNDLLCGPGEEGVWATGDDIGLILYTSGTTGFPKGVMHTQKTLVTAGEYCVERLHLQPTERMLCILPFFHINALIYSLMGAAVAGASLVIAPRFSASGFWRLAADSEATQVNIIAAVGRILMRRPRTEFVRNHRLRKLYGAPISADIYHAFQGEFGIQTLIEGYGLTETPCVCSNPYAGPHHIGSIGIPTPHPRDATPSAEMRIVDDAGRDVPPGQTGQLFVRSPLIMRGYYRDPAGTDEQLTEGWFRTGDLVRRDSEGYYTFVARQKDIIRRRGENISGAELDEVVGQHPDIQAVAAIPVSSDLGEDEIFIVAVRRTAAALTEAALRQWCEQRLSKVKLPRFIAFVDALPYTPSHRVAKFQLRADASLKARAIEFVE